MTRLLPFALACASVVVVGCGHPSDPLTPPNTTSHINSSEHSSDHSSEHSGETTACTTDSDCAEREACVDGACTAPTDPPTPACTSDADCNNGDACTDGACVEVNHPLPTCSTDTDCADGTTCQQGECVRGPPPPVEVACTVFPDSCGDGQRCYPVGGRITDGVCGDVGPVVLGGACEDVPFGGDLACARGLVCTSVVDATPDSLGVCVTLCVANSDCGADGFCAVFELDDGPAAFGACVVAGGT